MKAHATDLRLGPYVRPSVCSSWSKNAGQVFVLDKYDVKSHNETLSLGAEAKWPRFDEQDTWELIELGGSVESLGKQLKEAVRHID